MIARIASIGIVLALGGCATLAPTAEVIPGRGKTFEAFHMDQMTCEQYTDQQMAGAADSYNRSQIGTAVVATVLGAGLGAAVGGGYGAGIGAASGAVVGTVATGVGSGTATLQRRYDMVYSQCMHLHGNRAQGWQ